MIIPSKSVQIIPEGGYFYDIIDHNEYFMFSDNVQVYIRTEHDVELYLTYNSEMKNHEITFECFTSTKLNLFFDEYDLDYNLFIGKIFRDKNGIRYIFDSKFTVYIENDQDIQIKYKSYENSKLIRLYFSEDTGNIEYETLNSEYNNRTHEIVANITSGSSMYFIANVVNEKYGTKETTVGIIIVSIIIVGLGIIVKSNPEKKKVCLPPNEWVNGKCVDTLKESLNQPINQIFNQESLSELLNSTKSNEYDNIDTLADLIKENRVY